MLAKGVGAESIRVNGWVVTPIARAGVDSLSPGASIESNRARFGPPLFEAEIFTVACRTVT